VLQLFRNNSPFTVIVLFIFALLVKFQVVLHPVVPIPLPGHFLYNSFLRALHYLFGNNGFGYSLLAIVILFSQALFLKGIATRHKLFQRATYVPAFVYLLLSSIYPPFSTFSETLIINWLLLGAVDTMFSFTKTNQPQKLIFNASFLMSLAAMFQFSALAFFFLLLVGMVLFRPPNFGEWSVAFIGYITPPYLLAGTLFLVDRVHFFKLWPRFEFSLSSHSASIGFIIFAMICILIMLAGGIYSMLQNVALSNIYVRRDWTAITFYLTITVLVALLSPDQEKSAWLITLPALSIIVSHSLVLEKNKSFANFIFYFSLIFLSFCLWANN